MKSLLRFSPRLSTDLVLYKSTVPALMPKPMVVLDFEFDRLRNINEIGALLVAGERIIDIFHVCLPCSGIYREKISSMAALSFLFVMPTQRFAIKGLLDFIGNNPVIAHNAGVEKSLLKQHANNLSLPFNINPFLCTINLSNKLLPNLESRQLSKIAEHLGLSRPEIYHRALNDAYTTYELLLAIKSRLCDEFALMPEDHFEFFVLASGLSVNTVHGLLANHQGRDLLIAARVANEQYELKKSSRFKPSV